MTTKKIIDIIKEEVQKEPTVTYNIWYFRIILYGSLLLGIFCGKYII